MKFCMHLSTRIQDKRNELPLLNSMTDLALDADVSGFSAISLTEHHLHENQGYQNSLLFACALAPRLTQATLILATVNPALHHPVRLVESCNLIDQLNAGRLVVVFGSGFKDTDLVAFGRDLAERNALFEQGMRTVLDIWGYDGTGGPLEFAVGADRGRLDVRRKPVVLPQAAPDPGTRNPESGSDCRCRRARLAGVHGDKGPGGRARADGRLSRGTIGVRPRPGDDQARQGMVGGREGGARGGD